MMTAISPGWAGLILFGFLLLFLLGGMPVSFGILLTCILFLTLVPIRPMVAIAQQALGNMGGFTFLAVPLFMLAGYIMEGSGISRRLVNWVRCIFGNMRGGVGVVAIISCAVFASLTGSGVATVAAIGGLMMPALKDSNYPDYGAAGLIASAGCLGPIIPPSIPMLLYGTTMQLSIPAMFMGGLFPGLLLTGVYLGVHYFLVRTRWNVKTTQEHYTAKEKWLITWKALPALSMPLIILGGIYGGIFTPTESAAVGCWYAMIVGFITKDLTLKQLVAILKKTMSTSSSIALIVGAGGVFTYLMSTTSIPTAATNALVPLLKTPSMFLALMTIVLFIAGALVDAPITIILVAPILSPVGIALGIDPLHLGVAFCVNLVIGLITPPFGNNLFTAAATTEQSYEDVLKGVLPFMFASMAVVIIITYCPAITTWFPHFLGYR